MALRRGRTSPTIRISRTNIGTTTNRLPHLFPWLFRSNGGRRGWIQRTVTKPKPSSSNDSVTTNASDSQAMQQTQQHTQSSSLSSSSQQKPEPGKAASRDGSCRVCLKSFKEDDFHKTCAECHHKVCEDCASYSKLDDSEDAVNIPYIVGYFGCCA